MDNSLWDTLLAEIRHVHATHPALKSFCAFPDDLEPLDVTPHITPPADLMAADPGLFAGDMAGLRDAFRAVGPVAHWRETYKHTTIGQDFLDRFGCYAVIGGGGRWISASMSSFVVYMPPGLDYPWHHHPAEEIYLVLAGEAQFQCEGSKPETLGPGQSSFHADNRPHAMATFAHPVMAYVVWRNHLGIKPVLTPWAVDAT